MKMSNNSSQVSYLFYLLIITLLFCICDAKINLPRNLNIPSLFAFGDSIVDQGNNNNLSTLVKANFAPYGKDFNGGNNPTGRFTNSRTPADLLAQELGIKDIVPAYLDPNLQDKDLNTGVSFASGGSGYDPQTPHLVSVISLSDQLNYFKEYIEKLKGIVGEEKASYILANALFLVVAGSDDLANTYYTIGIQRLKYDISSYADLMVSSAASFIQELYNLGARRFAVFGIPPIGCLPSQRTLGGGSLRICVEEYNQASQLVNSKLEPSLDSLNKKLDGSRVVYIDIYTPLLDLILRPQHYGFEVVDKGCCGTGKIEVAILCTKYSSTCSDVSKYIFWDSYHPTDHGYQALSTQVLEKYINKFI